MLQRRKFCKISHDDDGLLCAVRQMQKKQRYSLKLWHIVKKRVIVSDFLFFGSVVLLQLV